ncbi:MAG: glycosyltransferase family 2 protein [candidate division Zixibacteria bacterium]|nr:glycosyltransferase family 2 protein [candidate division Zixibacteria bacterium]
MNSIPNVHIVIVNYSTWEDTIECMESVHKIDYPKYKVIVVDVANERNSCDHLSSWIDKSDNEVFTLLRLSENRGFAAANNLALDQILRESECEYIWLLNNDTVVENDSLTHLCKYFIEQSSGEARPAFLGSKILDYHHRDIIQTVGATFNPMTGYIKLVGMGEKDEGQHDIPNKKINHVIGASMFFHKSIINDIGLMPEDYFIYFEDVDWCISAVRKGYYNTVCIDSIVYHKLGGSTGNDYLENKFNPQTSKYLYINYIKFYRKFYRYLIPVAYLILLKQSAGKFYHKRFQESFMILKIFLKMLFGITK